MSTYPVKAMHNKEYGQMLRLFFTFFLFSPFEQVNGLEKYASQ